MKRVYRNIQTKDYWNKRWEEAGVDESNFQNMEIYPIKYSEMVMGELTGKERILEAGVGSGRLFFHYKSKGKNIYGMDYSETAIQNILDKDPGANVVCGSITDMPYDNGYFDVMMAFGLYHSIPQIKEIDLGFKETNRVLKKGGKLIFSVRLDNYENYLLEKINRKRTNKPFLQFHKWQFDVPDVKYFTKKHGFQINDIFYARNVSFLFKYDVLRSKSMKSKYFKESTARSEGFKLNVIGNLLDSFLHRHFPKSFSNLIVVIAEKV